MQQHTMHGYRFDTGPSLFTMPFILESIFEECGRDMSDYLTLLEPNPLCRYIYRDGTVFDNVASVEGNEEQIARFAPEDAGRYREFLSHSETLYNKTADAFLYNPLYDLHDLKGLQWGDLLSINAFSSVSSVVDRHFKSDYLRKFFKRFTTYNGSSPYQAPATLNVIPHVELTMGAWYPKGGLYQIARSLEALALEMGVEIRYNEPVQSLRHTGKTITHAVLQHGEAVSGDSFISNADATETITRLLPDTVVPPPVKQKQNAIEPSCSGFVLLLACNRSWELLRHHTLFFSDDYEAEFRQIFREQRVPDDPTIYVANTSASDASHAPDGGSNLFVLINTPYLNDTHDWSTLSLELLHKLVARLEAAGLTGLKESIVDYHAITPLDFYHRYRSNRGSIYGTSSNGIFSAFLRPRNRLRDVDNLYLVGGSTHPGGGIPLVLQSALNAAALFDRQR